MSRPLITLLFCAAFTGLGLDGLGAHAASMTAPVAGEIHPPHAPQVHRAALSGGAEVYCLERPQLPLQRVEIQVAWAGTQASTLDQLAAGLAGDMLAGGTRHHSGPEFAAAMDRQGASWDVGVGRDQLWAWVELPSDGVGPALDLLGEMLFQSRYSWAPVRRQRRLWASWLDDLAYDLRQVHRRGENHAWYPPDHPSRHDALPVDIRSVPITRVRQLVDRVLEQGKARIVTSGAGSLDDLLPHLERNFGRLTGTQEAVPPPAVTPKPTLWLVDRSGFGAAMITVMVPGPPLTQPTSPEADLLVELLAQAFTSRLSLDLREQRGLTYGVRGIYEAGLQDGRISVYLEAPTLRAVEALQAIHEHMDRLVAGGVRDDELRRARAGLLFQAGRVFTTNAGAATWLSDRVGLGLDPDLDVQRWQEMATTTPTELDAAAASLFTRAQRVSIITGDRHNLEAQLDQAGLTPDRIISARSLAGSR